MRDYIELYNLEGYLFSKVGPSFRSTGHLSSFDFFCIIIWKANRSKSKVAARLRGKAQQSLPDAIASLLEEIKSAPTPAKRLGVLMDGWGFRLPMASAILTVLYPEDFTVYDVRVCEVLDDFKDAQYMKPLDILWQRYQAYVAAVKAAVPSVGELRNKDRYLWGKSFATQLEGDIQRGFEKASEDEELEA